jgi:hypothetical protein
MRLPIFLYAIWLPGSLAVYSEYFPPPVEGVTVLSSKQNKNITLSYKKVSATTHRSKLNPSNDSDRNLRFFVQRLHSPPCFSFKRR